MPVRLATTADADVLRALRLQAMDDAEHAFNSHREREEARTPADWRRWLEHGATFFLEADDGAPGASAVGLAACTADQHDAAVWWLESMWVHPAARASGGADALVAAVVAWAVGMGGRELRLHVVHGNARAVAFYERAGFAVDGPTTVRERDGAVELEMRRPLP